jgi:hypothetical protein
VDMIHKELGVRNFKSIGVTQSQSFTFKMS